MTPKEDPPIQCEDCGGTGTVERQRRNPLAPDYPEDVEMVCNLCGGTGGKEVGT